MAHIELTSRISLMLTVLLSYGYTMAQTVFHALPEEQVMNGLVRSSGGSYYAWKETDDGVHVHRYDHQMDPVWSRQIQLTPGINNWSLGTYTTTSAVRTPDDGLCIIGVGNQPQPSLVLFKVNNQGDLSWQRTISIPIHVGATAYLRGEHWHDIEFNESGEIFIKMIESFPGGSRILKLNSQGEPLWLVRNSSQHGIITSILPDKNGGCYFTLSYGGEDYQKVSIGQLDNNGFIEWHDRYTWPNSLELRGYRLQHSTNDAIVLGGTDDADLFTLMLSSSGDPLSLRYHLPNVPYTDCPVIWIYGFETATDGRMAFQANHSTHHDSFVLLLDPDGGLTKARKLPWNMVTEEDWRLSMRPIGLDALGNELSIPIRSLKIWNPSTIFTTTMVEVTSPFDPDGLCYFQPMGFDQTTIPFEEISIEPIGEMAAMQLPVTGSFIAVSSPMDQPISSLYCGSVSVPETSVLASERLLLRTFLQRGEPLLWRTDLADKLLVYDGNGRLVSGTSGLLNDIQTTDFSPGAYQAIFLNKGGLRISSERFVIQ